MLKKHEWTYLKLDYLYILRNNLLLYSGSKQSLDKLNLYRKVTVYFSWRRIDIALWLNLKKMKDLVQDYVEWILEKI